MIFSFDKKMRRAVSEGADVAALSALPVRERIGRAKSIPFAGFSAECAAIEAEMDAQIAALDKEGMA
jgi:V/A-type H+-transporting ATPase subunit A